MDPEPDIPLYHRDKPLSKVRESKGMQKNPYQIWSVFNLRYLSQTFSVLFIDHQFPHFNQIKHSVGFLLELRPKK
jgi:hypothetical protein